MSKKPVGFYTEGRGKRRKVRPITARSGRRRRPFKVTAKDVKTIQSQRSLRARRIDSGGIATDKMTLKPGDRVSTRWGNATIRTISKNTARISFDDIRHSLYGMSNNSKIAITGIREKLSPNKKYIYTKLKNTSLPKTKKGIRSGSVTPEMRKTDKKQFEPFVGKKVTIAGEQEGLYGKVRYVKQGRFVRGSDDQIYFMEKGQRTKGKQVTAGLFDGFHATLTIREIRPTWG